MAGWRRCIHWLAGEDALPFMFVKNKTSAEVKRALENILSQSICLERPLVYRLKDYDGDIKERTFYTEDLQQISLGKDETCKNDFLL